MKKTFYAYYRPSEKEFDKIWKDSLLIPDTNVLLNLYRYSITTSNELFNVFEKFSNRLWLPHQVAFEYQQNRLSVISKQTKSYNEVREILTKNETNLKSNLDSYRNHPLLNVQKICEKVHTTFTHIQDDIDKLEREHPDLIKRDNIRDKITLLFDDKIGKKFDDNKTKQLIIDANARYTSKIPPGYEDANEKDGIKKYGDLILWYQIIEKAKNDQKSVILITDEKKDDWWWKFNGEIVGPRPELIEEFVSKTENWFYMYKSDQFMNFAQEFFKQKVNRKTIDEIREINKQDATESNIEKIFSKLENNKKLLGQRYLEKEKLSLELNEINSRIQYLLNINDLVQEHDDMEHSLFLKNDLNRAMQTKFELSSKLTDIDKNLEKLHVQIELDKRIRNKLEHVHKIDENNLD